MPGSPARIEFEGFTRIAADATQALRALGSATASSGLERPLLELVKLRASQLNGCAFCIQFHLNLARQLSVPAEKLDLLAAWEDAGVFSPRETAALAWCEALTTQAARGASDAAYAAVRSAFSETETVFLTVAIGTINQWNRIAGALRFTPPVPGEADMSEAGAPPLPAGLRAIGERDIAACFPLMRHLRPHLVSPEELVGRWRRQAADGYRLLAVWTRATPSALAGYRFQETLVHGRFLYVDDLVTDPAERRSGHGGRLLEHLKSEGRAAGCRKLVLDTGLENALAHRFYYRAGLLAQALRFNVPLEAPLSPSLPAP